MFLTQLKLFTVGLCGHADVCAAQNHPAEHVCGSIVGTQARCLHTQTGIPALPPEMLQKAAMKKPAKRAIFLKIRVFCMSTSAGKCTKRSSLKKRL